MTSPRTLLGPLTTTWTPPALCSVYMNTCDTCTTAWQAQTCNPESKAHDFTGCWPPFAKSIPDPGVMMGGGLYSPGIICPIGYTTVAMATSGGSTGWGIEYSMNKDVTAAACCPTGFGWSTVVASNTYAATCVLTVTSAKFSTVQCDGGQFNDFAEVTIPRTVQGKAQSSYVLFAPLFQLNFKPKDVPATSSSSYVSPMTSASPGSTATSRNPTSTYTSFPVSPTEAGGSAGSSSDPSGIGSGDKSTGLSRGAKAGIAVGSAAGAILLGAMLLLFLRAMRRRRETHVVAEGATAHDSMWPIPRKPELGGREVQELDGTGVFRSLSRKLSRRRAGDPVVRAASPSAARGSVPKQLVPGPFELEAPDSPAISNPMGMHRPDLVSPVTSATTRYSGDFLHHEV